jgi:hypothetical protein
MWGSTEPVTAKGDERSRGDQGDRDAVTSWTTDELELIAGARELELAPLGSDGVLRKPVTIWVVRQGDDLYVRSWRGPGSAWLRRVHSTHEGHIRAGGVERDVTFVDTEGAGVNAAIDVRYRAKYGDSGYVTPMVTEPARSTTIKLVPR